MSHHRRGVQLIMPPLTARQVMVFLAFSHGWTWAWWGTAALWGTSIWEPPAAIFFYVGGAGVVLAGVVMSRVVYGPAGLRDLGRRLVDPRPISGRWWTVTILCYPLLAMLAAGIAVLLGGSTRPLNLQAAAARLADPAGLLVMMGFIVLVGPFPEEIGWRGYLQDRLQARWSALTASLFVGIIWWTWHLPLFVLPGYFDAFGPAPPTPFDILSNVMPAAVLYGWLYANTGRSVLAVILFHFMENFTGEFLGIAEEVRPYRLMLTVALVVFVVWKWGPKTLNRGAVVQEAGWPSQR